MGLLKRIFGICETKPPSDARCWKYSGGKIEIELERAPELSNRGGAIRLEGRELPERVLILNGDDDNFHAFKNKCTHMGRRIDPVNGHGAVQCCSLSKSTFNYTGEMISGPAKGPLTAFKVESENGKLIILIE